MAKSAPVSQDLLDMLSGFGCLVFENQHFVYKSGKHGHAYINVDPVLYQPNAIATIATKIARASSRAGLPIPEVVADPAVGAISFGLMVADRYNEQIAYKSADIGTRPGSYPSQVMHVFADKLSDGSFALERTGFARACEGKRVLVVEDVLNSGTSTRAVIDCVRQAGGNVIGVSCFVSRGGLNATDLGVPMFTAVVDIDMQQFEANECPLCEAKVPMVIDAGLGKGRDWAEGNPDFPGGFIELLVD